MSGVSEVKKWNVQRAVTAMNFIRDEQGKDLLVIADSSGQLALYAPTTGDRYRLYEHEAEVSGAATAGGGESAPRVVYDLAYVPRKGTWPDLVTVGGAYAPQLYNGSASVMLPAPQVRDPRVVRLHDVDAMQRSDGSATIVAAGRDETVYLWSKNAAQNGSWSVKALAGHSRAVHALMVLRRERWLAVAHDAGITVWDLESAEPERLRGPFGSGDARALAVFHSARGEPRLASACEHGIRIWNMTNEEQLAYVAQRESISAIVAVNGPDGDPLLAAAHEDRVTLWNPISESPERPPMRVGDGRVKALAKILAGDGTTLLAAADDTGQVAVWRLPASRSTTTVLRGHGGWVNSLVSFDAQGRAGGWLLASASDDGSVRTWDDNGEGSVLLRDRPQVQALVRIDDDRVAAADESGAIRLLDVTGQGRCSVLQESCGRRIRALAAYAGGDRIRIVAVGTHPHPVVYDPCARSSMELEDRGESNGDANGRDTLIRTVAAVQLDAARAIVATGDSKGQVKVWVVEPDGNATCTRLPLACTVQVRAVALLRTRAGQAVLAWGGDDGQIRMLDLRAVVDKRPGSAALHLDGDPCSADLWPGAFPLDGYTEPFTVEAHSGPVTALTVIDDGAHSFLVSGGADRFIRVWDIDRLLRGEVDARTAKVGEQNQAHANWVRVLVQVPPASTFSPARGQGPGDEPSPPSRRHVVLASGGDDGSIRLWDLADGVLVRRSPEVHIAGFGDRPSRTDLLNRGDIVDVLADLLAPRDAGAGNAPVPAGGAWLTSGTSGPQVVTIVGAWGAGKTSVMKDLRRELDPPRSPAPGADGWRARRGLSPWQAMRVLRRGAAQRETSDVAVDRVVTAWFNPWAHQSREQVWAGLAWEIISSTREALGGTESQRQRYWLNRNLDRVDRAALRRILWHRIWRPVIATAVVFLAPAIAALLAEHAPWTWLPAAGVGGLLALLAVYALYQSFCGQVSVYLPPCLFDGPVQKDDLLATGLLEPTSRESAYLGRSGQLHQTQRDVYLLVRDLMRNGCQLVVFIDDLDRCQGDTTADVFEAINGFLAALDPGPGYLPARFVMGIDPAVVAYRLAEAYPGSRDDVPWQSPDDPNLGWSLLRKMCQLSVVLPAIGDVHTARLLKHHAQRRMGMPEQQGPTPGNAGSSPEDASSAPRTRRRWRLLRLRRRSETPGDTPDRAAGQGAAQPAGALAGLAAGASSIPGQARRSADDESAALRRADAASGATTTGTGAPDLAAAYADAPLGDAALPDQPVPGAVGASGSTEADPAGRDARGTTTVTDQAAVGARADVRRERGAWRWPWRVPSPRNEASTGAARSAAGTSSDQEVIPLEGDPMVRDHLHQLVTLRPRQSMRETKRLLTLWVFYVRLLRRRLPTNVVDTADGACHALTLAEIVTRWPAFTSALSATYDGVRGLRLLIDAATVENEEAALARWAKRCAALGLDREKNQPALANLWHFLRTHGNEQVAAFADYLL